jgi:hypothetical protein
VANRKIRISPPSNRVVVVIVVVVDEYTGYLSVIL